MATDAAPEINPRTQIKGEGKNAVVIVGEKEVLRVGQQGNLDIRTGGTLLEEAHSYIRATAEKAKTGEALVDGEVDGFTAIIDKLTQRSKDGGRALRRDMAAMIVQVNEVNSQDAAQNWKDLNDPKKSKAIKAKNWEMGLLHEYIKQSGGDSTKLDWEVVSVYGQALVEGQKGQIKKETLRKLAYASVRKDSKGKEQFYQRLLMREGYKDAKKTGHEDREWRDAQEKEKAFDVLLGVRQPEATVDLAGYLNRQFYEQVVVSRFEAMGPAEHGKLVVEKHPLRRFRRKEEKLVIEVDKNNKKGRIWPSLGYATVNEHTVIGKFLESISSTVIDGRKVNVARYWRGKAALNEAYYYGYKQQTLGMKDAQARQHLGDWFSEMKDVADIREYIGYAVTAMIGEDPRLADAIYVLYSSGKHQSYSEKLKLLGGKYHFSPTGELPSFITQAIMYQEIMALDPGNISPQDNRDKMYNAGKWFNLEVVSDAAGKLFEFLGIDFAFTTLPSSRIGVVSEAARNYDYKSLGRDDSEFDPDQNEAQNDLEWQQCHFFRLAQSHKELRRAYDKTKHQILINGQPVEAVPGQTGEFPPYVNDWFDTETQEFTHRKVVFENFKHQLELHNQLKKERGFGLAGWDEVEAGRLTEYNTLAKRVVKMVEFLEKPLTLDVKYGGIELKINKEAEEFWWSYELGTILSLFANNPKSQVFAAETDQLTQLLVMRECARDFRAWGQTIDLQNPELIKTMRNQMDLARATKYDISGLEALKNLLEIVKASPDDILLMNITPAQILGFIESAKHDFTQTQHYPRLIKLIELADYIVVRKYIELEIASVQDMMKAIAPGGEVQMGAFETIKKVVGPGAEKYAASIGAFRQAHRTFLGEAEKMGYMDRLREGIYTMISSGLYENYENLVLSNYAREFLAEAADWARSRQWPIQHRLLLSEFAVVYNQNIPVETYRVLPAIVHIDGRIEIDRTMRQGINRTMLKNFFRVLDINKREENMIIGNVHGGQIPIYYSIDKAQAQQGYIYQQEVRDGKLWVRLSEEQGIWTSADNIDFVRKIKEGERQFQSGEFVVFNFGKKEWERKIPKKGIQIFIDEAANTADTALKPKENMHAKVRLCFDVVTMQWKEVLGDWSLKPDRTGYEFKTGPEHSGQSRKLKLGTPTSVKVISGDVVVLEGSQRVVRRGKDVFGKISANELQGVDNQGIVQEAVMPWAIWNNQNQELSAEELREMFGFHKYQIILGFEMGKASPTEHGGGGTAHTSSYLHQSPEIVMTDFSRTSYEFQKMVRANIRMSIIRKGTLAGGLAKLFHPETLREEIVKQFGALFEKMATGEQWGPDITIVRELMRDMTIYDWSLMTKTDASRALYERIFAGRAELSYLDQRIKNETWLSRTERSNLINQRNYLKNELKNKDKERKRETNKEKTAILGRESKNWLIRSLGTILTHKFKILGAEPNTVPLVATGAVMGTVGFVFSSLLTPLGAAATIGTYFGLNFLSDVIGAYYASKVEIDFAKLSIWTFVQKFLKFDAVVTPE